MRDFSKFEKQVIEKISRGSVSFSHLFDDDFRQSVKITAFILPQGNHRFEFLSDSYNSNQIYDKINDIVDLINYLDKNALLRKYFQPINNLRVFDSEQQISIGDGTSTQPAKVVAVIENALYLAEFIKENENVLFSASESLKTLKKHGYRTLQERLARKANWTAISVGLIAVLISNAVTYKISKETYNDSNKEFNNLKSSLFKKMTLDSTQIVIAVSEIKSEFKNISKRVDSIVKAKTKQQKQKNKQSHVPTNPTTIP